MPSAPTYSTHFNAFSGDINLAARIWFGDLQLRKLVDTDPQVNRAVHLTTRYWADQQYSNLLLTVMVAGRIFDEDRRSHSCRAMLAAARVDINYFSKAELLKRKQKSAPDMDFTSYMRTAYAIKTADIDKLEKYLEKAELIWLKVKKLRNKRMAHNSILTATEHQAIYAAIKYSDISNMLKMLLTIHHIMQEAEWNGRKPDFRRRKLYAQRHGENLAKDVMKILSN